jgi:hypothetical protein
MLEKRTLSLEALDSEAALQLPSREMLSLVTVVITNLLNNNTVDIDVKNNNVAVQVCAVVNALNIGLFGGIPTLTCAVHQ